jgi:PPOX class probable F420-dependent enzyme
MPELSDKARALIEDRNLGFLATVMPDGSPQVSPVWVDLENGYVRFNTAAGRVKEKNIRRDPRIAISVADRNDPYSRIALRGRVVDIVEGDEAEEHIDALSEKYRGVRPYTGRKPGERRVLVRVRPERVSEAL